MAGLAIQSAAVAAAGPLPAALAVPAPRPRRGFSSPAPSGARSLASCRAPRPRRRPPRQLARRRGVVTQGTASRGRPAEVRVVDRHGNAHFLRAEPLGDGDVIAQGTEVLVVSAPREAGHRLVPLAD